MNDLQILRDEYPGDAAWRYFVSVFKDDWDTVNDKSRYIRAFDNEDLAIVLSIKMGDRSLLWFDQANMALENQSPRTVLKNQIMGDRILRTLLMRIP